MHRFSLLAALLLSLSLYAQSDTIDPHKRDTFIQRLEERRKEMKLHTDSVMRRIDSINLLYQQQQRSLDMEQNQRNMESLVRQMKEREEKQHNQAMIRLGFAALLLAMAGWTWWKRRKRNASGSPRK